MKKMVHEGMYVMEGGPLFEVAALDPIWVDLSVFERDASNISPGHEVVLDCPVHPGMIFHGSVELIEPTLDARSRTIVLRVEVDNRSEIIRPGMVMNADLEVNRGDVLVLPRRAVLHTGDGDLVYLLAGENLWKPRRVETGRDFGDLVEIASGITEEDAVAGTAVFLLDSEAQLKGIPRPVEDDQETQTGGGGHVH
jgi:RND family efflux transporter MFP subunit